MTNRLIWNEVTDLYSSCVCHRRPVGILRTLKKCSFLHNNLVVARKLLGHQGNKNTSTHPVMCTVYVGKNEIQSQIPCVMYFASTCSFQRAVKVTFCG